MSEITIRAFAGFRERFGEKNTVFVETGTTVLSVLERFAENIPAAHEELFMDGKLRSHVILMYNRERIDAKETEETAVCDGDEIVLYPPVSGG
ncbi:MAG: MoaD/ThiS family protein [Methanocalculaceae archaeon]|nr:MoaD/ThiS family protein [Methanocalculaceae archaeon]